MPAADSIRAVEVPDNHPTRPTRPAMPQMVALLIATQLRREAEDCATPSEDFGRGMAHAARTVERIADAMRRGER